MTIDELKQLLPFYVAGTLELDEVARVDEALKNSEELRNELQFWRSAQAAISVQSEYAHVGHVSAMQIVDFAEGTTQAEERPSIERHLQSCGPCSEEYRLVKASLVARDTVSPSFSKQIANIIKSIRIVYAVPAAAAIVLAAFIFLGRPEKSPQQPGLPPGILPPIADQRISLWLTYEAEMRSTSRKSLPTLSIAELDKEVDAFIAVPHSTLNGIRYHVEAGSGNRNQWVLQDSIQRYASSTMYDSLHVIIPRNIIPNPGDTLGITIKEVLPVDLKELTPEEYRFSVVIDLAKGVRRR